jgi:hypothetical protein
MPIFGWHLAENLAAINQSGQNALAFVFMKLYQLPPDP